MVSCCTGKLYSLHTAGSHSITSKDKLRNLSVIHASDFESQISQPKELKGAASRKLGGTWGRVIR